MGKINESKAVCSEKIKRLHRKFNSSCEKLLWNHILQNNPHKCWNNCMFKVSDNPLNELNGSGEIHLVGELINPKAKENVYKKTNVTSLNSLVNHEEVATNDIIINKRPVSKNVVSLNITQNKAKYKQNSKPLNDEVQLYCNKSMDIVLPLRRKSFKQKFKQLLRKREVSKPILAIQSSKNTYKHGILKKKHKSRRKNGIKTHYNKSFKSNTFVDSVNDEDFLSLNNFKKYNCVCKKCCSLIYKNICSCKIKNKNYVTKTINSTKNQYNLDENSCSNSKHLNYNCLKKCSINSKLVRENKTISLNRKQNFSHTSRNNRSCVLTVKAFQKKFILRRAKSLFIPDISTGIVLSCINKKIDCKKRLNKSKIFEKGETQKNKSKSQRSSKFSVPSFSNLTVATSSEKNYTFSNWNYKNSNYPNPSSEGNFTEKSMAYTSFYEKCSAEIKNKNKRRKRNKVNRKINLNKNITDEVNILKSNYLSKCNSSLSIKTTKSDSFFECNQHSNSFYTEKNISADETVYNSFVSSDSFGDYKEVNNKFDKKKFSKKKIENQSLCKTYNKGACNNSMTFRNVVKLYQAYHDGVTNKKECLCCINTKIFEPFLEKLYWNGFLCPKAKIIFEAALYKTNKNITKDKKTVDLKTEKSTKETKVKTKVECFPPVRTITSAKEKCTDVLKITKNSLPFTWVEKFVKSVIEKAINHEAYSQTEVYKSVNDNHDTYYSKHFNEHNSYLFGNVKQPYKNSKITLNNQNKNEQITIESLDEQVTDILEKQYSITDQRSSECIKNNSIPYSLKSKHYKKPNSLIDQLNDVYEELNNYQIKNFSNISYALSPMQKKKSIEIDDLINKDISVEELDILSKQVAKLNTYENFLSNVEHFSHKSNEELQEILCCIKSLENKINQTLYKKSFLKRDYINKNNNDENLSNVCGKDFKILKKSNSKSKIFDRNNFSKEASTKKKPIQSNEILKNGIEMKKGSNITYMQLNQSEAEGLTDFFVKIPFSKSKEVESADTNLITPLKNCTFDSSRHSIENPNRNKNYINEFSNETAIFNKTCNKDNSVDRIDSLKVLSRSHNISNTDISDNFNVLYSKRECNFDNIDFNKNVTEVIPKVDTTLEVPNKTLARLPTSCDSTEVKVSLSSILLTSNDNILDNAIAEEIDNMPEFLNNLENDLIKQKNYRKLCISNNNDFKNSRSNNVIGKNYKILPSESRNTSYIKHLDRTESKVSDVKKDFGFSKSLKTTEKNTKYVNAKTSCAFKREDKVNQDNSSLINWLRSFLLSKLKHCDSKSESTTFFKQSLKKKLEDICCNVKHIDLKELSILKKINSYHDQIEQLVSESISNTSCKNHRITKKQKLNEIPRYNNLFEKTNFVNKSTKIKVENTFSNNIMPKNTRTKKSDRKFSSKDELLKTICISNRQTTEQKLKKTEVNISEVEDSFLYFSQDSSFNDRFYCENSNSKEDIVKFPKPSCGHSFEKGDHSNNDQILKIVKLALNKINDHNLTKCEQNVNFKHLQSVWSDRHIGKFQTTSMESYHNKIIKNCKTKSSQLDNIIYNSTSEDSLFVPPKSYEYSSSESSISISKQCKNPSSENKHSAIYPEKYDFDNNFVHFDSNNILNSKNSLLKLNKENFLNESAEENQTKVISGTDHRLKFKHVISDSILELKQYFKIWNSMIQKLSYVNNNSSKESAKDQKYVSLSSTL